MVSFQDPNHATPQGRLTPSRTPGPLGASEAKALAFVAFVFGVLVGLCF